MLDADSDVSLGEDMDELDSKEEEDASTSLWKSHYSSNFNSLAYLGIWPMEFKSRTKRRLFKIYQIVAFAITLALIISLFVDLFSVFGDIKKTSWNICVNSLFTGAVMKCIWVYGNSAHLNDLRQKLHADMLSRVEEEDVAIQATTLLQLRRTRNFMYGLSCSFGAIWQVARYRSKYSDVKQVPIPLYIPKDIDLNVSFNFDAIFISFTIIGMVGLYFILEEEMAMFSILLQIKREYDILLKDIPKLNMTNEFCEDDERRPRQKETNPGLRSQQTKTFLKQLCTRQKIVMGYTDAFEYCYNHPMVLQILVNMMLTVSIGLQCILFSNEFSTELAFQVGYLSIVLSDMFVLSFMGSTLSTQCREVGYALYDTFWYAMDLDIQKDLCLMILTSQRPPRITFYRAMEINLSTYTSIMKNVYSWLALFRQVAIKE